MIIQIILNLLCPSKSTYFKLRVRETWFSDRFFTISYSTNYGISWNNIKERGRHADSYTGLIYKETIAYASIPDSYRLSYFDSYHKVKCYNDKLNNEINMVNINIKNDKKLRLNKQSERMKEINK